MSKNTCKIIGFVTMIISVFLIMGGLYLPQAEIPAFITIPCLVSGIILCVIGVVFYKILKTD